MFQVHITEKCWPLEVVANNMMDRENIISVAIKQHIQYTLNAYQWWTGSVFNVLINSSDVSLP